MSSNAFFSLVSNDGIEIYSTHLATLEWAVNVIKTYCPNCDVVSTKNDHLVTGEVCRYRLTRLGQNKEQLVNWLFQQLCLNGWEPFAVEGNERMLRMVNE